MTDLIIYALKTIVALGIFAVVYRYALIKDVNFRARRFYLLNSTLISFVIPLLSFNLEFVNSFRGNTGGAILLDEITIFSNGFKSIESSSSIPISDVLFYTYTGIAILLALRVLYQIFTIILSIKKLDSQDHEGIPVFHIQKKNVSFSFFRFVFIGKTGGKEDTEKILAHEKVHAMQLHSIDVLIMEFLVILFWFNPMVWWFRNELKNVHEYLADEGALNEGFSPKSYQITLLEHLIGSASLSITNNFNYSLIKNRVTMMNKEKKGSKNTWKLFLIIPVAIMLVIGFACTEKADPVDNQDNSQISDKKSGTADESQMEFQGYTDEEIFYIVEDMPKFNNGDAAIEFRKYIGENLNYPEIAVEKGIAGRVIVQFAVNSVGKVVDAKVVASVDPALDKEAIRVVMSSPEWTPGKQRGKAVKVLFTFPINFALADDETSEEIKEE